MAGGAEASAVASAVGINSQRREYTVAILKHVALLATSANVAGVVEVDAEETNGCAYSSGDRVAWNASSALALRISRDAVRIGGCGRAYAITVDEPQRIDAARATARLLVVVLALAGEERAHIVTQPVAVLAVEARRPRLLNAVRIVILRDDAVAAGKNVPRVAGGATGCSRIDGAAQRIHDHTVPTDHHVALRALDALPISNLPAVRILHADNALSVVECVPLVAAGAGAAILVCGGTQRINLGAASVLEEVAGGAGQAIVVGDLTTVGDGCRKRAAPVLQRITIVAAQARACILVGGCAERTDLLTGVVRGSEESCRTALADAVQYRPAVGNGHRRPNGTVAVVEDIALVTTSALARLLVDAGAERINPKALCTVEVEGSGALPAATVLVERFTVGIRQADGTVACVELVALVAAGTLSGLWIDSGAQVVLHNALPIGVEEVAREALYAVAVGSELLAVAVSVLCRRALAGGLIQLIALVAARAEAVQRVECRTLIANLLAGLSIQPIA